MLPVCTTPTPLPEGEGLTTLPPVSVAPSFPVELAEKHSKTAEKRANMSERSELLARRGFVSIAGNRAQRGE